MQFRRLSDAFMLPGADVTIILIVAPGFAVGILIFLAEMGAARFVAVQGVVTKQLGELQKIRDAIGLFQRLVQAVAAPRNADVAAKTLRGFVVSS